MSNTVMDGCLGLRLPLIGALISASPLALAADADVAKAGAEQQENFTEVVITASGFEQDLTNAPASMSVLDQTEIIARPHANLLDMLKYEAGIDIGTTRDKTGQGSVSMRGLSGEYTLYLIDGKRQNNHGDIYPNNFGGNAFGHMPPAAAIERVEVVRGPASTLYGADALGGVVNIITKKVTDTWMGAVKASGTLQENDQFGDDRQVDFTLLGPLIGNTLGLGLRGTWYQSDASSPELAPALDPNGTLHYRSVGFGGGGRTVDSETTEYGLTLTYTPSQHQTLRLDFDRSNQRYDNTPIVDSESGVIVYPLGTKDNIEALWQERGGQLAPRAGYADDQEFSRDWWSLSHEKSWGAASSSVSLSYVDTANEGRTLPLTVTEREHLAEIYYATGDYQGLPEAERKAIAESTFLPRPDRPLESRQYTLDARLDIPFQAAGEHTLVIGAQVIDGELEDGVFGFEDNAPGQVQEQKMYSVFVEDSWAPIPAFTLTAGARYDEHDLFGTQVSPRLYGVYNLAPTWTLKGGASTGYKTPKTTDLYDGIIGFGGQGTIPFAGNPDLTPETSVNSELGLFWDSAAGHKLNITYFDSKFEDKIARGEAVSSCDLTGGVRPCVNLGAFGQLGYTSWNQNINIDEVSIQGVELVGRYFLHSDWTLNANYTWTDSEQESGLEQGQPLTNTAEHMANVSLGWQVLGNFSLTLQSELRSDRYRGWNTVTDEPMYFENYVVWNLGAHYQITDNITLFARINNLLDEQFDTYQTAFVDINGDGLYEQDSDEVQFTDDYNVIAANRNFWLSLQYEF